MYQFVLNAHNMLFEFNVSLRALGCPFICNNVHYSCATQIAVTNYAGSLFGLLNKNFQSRV